MTIKGFLALNAKDYSKFESLVDSYRMNQVTHADVDKYFKQFKWSRKNPVTSTTGVPCIYWNGVAVFIGE